MTIVLFTVGLIVGGQINRAIYRLAWNPQPIGPWSPPHPQAPQRTASDRLPVYGWLGLAREETVLERPFYWIRPIAIELTCAIGLAMLYQWVLGGGQHVWNVDGRKIPLIPERSTLYVQFAIYSVLFGLMLVATFIDFDEKTIPDAIVIPGTIVAYFFAAIFPATRLPFWKLEGVPPAVVASPDFLRLTSPLDWDPRLDGLLGLAIAILCLVGWWYALTPKLICFRYGLRKGVLYLGASIRKHLSWPLLWISIGSVLLTVAGWFWGGDHWVGLLSAIVGMAFGGGLVWAFRVVASRVLQQEALGFGDVTLMGMVGAFVGWQPALLIFFMAPFAGAVIAVAQYFITRDREIAFGPYLCGATAFLILCWNYVWGETWMYFELGPLVPIGLIICLFVLAILLYAYLLFKSWLFSR